VNRIDEILCNERALWLFWHCVSLASDGEWCLVDPGENFTDYLTASEYIAEYEGNGTVCGLEGRLAAKKMLEVCTKSFIHGIDKHFISVRKPVHKSKKIKMVNVEVLGEAADLIYQYCKENNCDPTYAVKQAFGSVRPIPESAQVLTAQDQIIANAVTEMLDKRFGERMANIEMTMGLIGETNVDQMEVGAIF
jgi:hypothetical protein